MKQMIKQIIGVFCMALALSSCVREELIEGAEVVEGKSIRVSLKMKMATMGDTPATRATDEQEKVISNIRVMIFDDLGKKVTDKSQEGSSKSIQIDTYTGKNRTVFVVANIFDEEVKAELTAAETLEQAQAISVNRTQLALGPADDQFEAHTRPLMMTGLMKNVTISPTSTALDELQLSFMVAKLTLNVSDATDSNQNVTLLGWDIADEPVNTFIYPNDHDVTTSIENDDDWHSSATTPQTRYQFKKRENLPGVANVKSTATMTIYMLENRRGGRRAVTADDIKDYPALGGVPPIPHEDRHKALLAPGRATYIYIYALHEGLDANNKVVFQQVVAKIYIGKDAIGDYNIERGSHYTFNVKVTGWNNIDVDSNVDHTMADVKIAEGTNLTMDTHPDFRALTVTSPKGWMAMEIVNDDGKTTVKDGLAFKADWLTLSPLSLMHMQQKQAALIWQEEITAGYFAHGRYIPNAKIRSGLTDIKKWWRSHNDAGISDWDDNSVSYERALNERRMCYEIKEIPFEANTPQTLYIYAEENAEETTRNAKIKLSFWKAIEGVTTPPAEGALPDLILYKDIKQVGFLTIYDHVNDSQSGMCQLDALGNTVGPKKRFAIEQFEEVAMIMNPGVGTDFQEMNEMQWGFTDKTLYEGLNKNRNGRFLTANAVFNDGVVTADAYGLPTWTSTTSDYRELYGGGAKYPRYTSAITQPYGGITQAPYYYPRPDRENAYHPIFNSSAARYCYEKNRDTNGDGKIDQDEALWYLPSRDQMLLIMIANELILQNSVDLTPITRGDDIFWTSTERSAYQKIEDGQLIGPVLRDQSYLVSLIKGFSPSSDEIDAHRVRCVRDIP